MLKYSIIISILFGFSFIQAHYTYRNIHYGDYLAITYDNNQGELDWDNSSNNLAFVSSNNGKREICYIDLHKLSVSSAGNGFYSANYLNELIGKENIYNSLFSSQDTAFYSPKWNKKGTKIMSIGKTKNQNEIFITSKKTKVLIGTKIKNVEAAHWKNDSTIYIVCTNNPNQLLEIRLQDKKKTILAETKFPIIGISKQNNSLLLTSKGGVSQFSATNNKLEWFKLPIKGNTVWRLAKLNFVGLNQNGNAQILDLNNANEHPFCYGDNNGPPAISGDKKFVAFYSEFFNGIIIKRIDKKFLME